MCARCVEKPVAQQRLMLALDKLAQVHKTPEKQMVIYLLLKGQKGRTRSDNKKIGKT